MDEYISREAAIDAVDVGNLHRGIIDALQAIISDIPAANVVEVVRCRDCVHYIAYRQDCGLYAVGKSNGLENPQPEDFCSRGERRDDL